MRQLNVGTPAQVSTLTKAYTQFRGVDFSADSTQVDESRSPEAQNIISDIKGYPEKRLGWRYLHRLGETIHSIFFCVFENGEERLFCHAGTKLYRWDKTDAEPSVAVEGLADAQSRHFVHGGKLYLLDGTAYRVITLKDDVYTMKNVSEADPYIPTVRISITGNAITTVNEKTGEFIGGHTYEEFESPNYLTNHRKCTMIGDAASTEYHLPESHIGEIVSVKVNDAAVTDFELNAEKGHITFKTAPAISPDGAGLANIEVEYTCEPKEEKEQKHTSDNATKEFALPSDAVGVKSVSVAGAEVEYTYADQKVTLTVAPAADVEIKIVYLVIDEKRLVDRINKCTIAETFGYFNDNRFFLAGETNLKYQNVDYMSGNDDPSYFPYDGFVRVGADSAPIMGYLKQHDALLIVKSDNEQDAQIFARTAMYDNEDGTMFPVQQGVKGVGAVSKNAFGNLRDDPLFLAKEGVFAIVSGLVKEQRSIQDRSMFVNNRLQKEPNLDRAIAATWIGYYVLCVNDHCYVADARQQTAMSSTEQMGYEWYYWNNIPAVTFFEHNGILYFGSKDGCICQFNSDELRIKKYSDGSYPLIKRSEMTAEQLATYDSIADEQRKHDYRESLVPGVAIEAVWATKADTFGTITNVKNIQKKGCAIMIKPYTRSSVELGYLTDREGRVSFRTELADILDFGDIDFSRFTFNSLDVPRVLPLGKKIKKFNILQFFLVSREINEGFGVYGIQLAYTIGGYVK